MSDGSSDDGDDGEDTPDMGRKVNVPVDRATQDRLASLTSEMRRNQELMKKALGGSGISEQLKDISRLQKSIKDLNFLQNTNLDDLGIKLPHPKTYDLRLPPNPALKTNELLAEQQETMVGMQIAMGQLAEHAAEEKVDRQEEQRRNTRRFWIGLGVSALAAFAAVGALIVMLFVSGQPANIEVTLSQQDVERLASASAVTSPSNVEPVIESGGSTPSSDLRPPW